MDFKTFYTLLLEANIDKRIEFLDNKWTPKIIEDKLLKDTFYAQGKPNNLIKWTVTSIDPSGGLYSDWIIRNIMKLPDGEKRRWLGEDNYKVTEDLTRYHTNKNLFKKIPGMESLTDINRINGFDDLYEKLKLLGSQIEDKAAIQKQKAIEKDIQRIWDTPEYLILIPNTYEASCTYGANTRWCTGSNKTSTYYDNYSKRGPLYIIIDRKANEKYQFHFQTQQYMDAEDSQLDLKEFFKGRDELKDKMMELAMKENAFGFVLLVDEDKGVSLLEATDDENFKKIITDNTWAALIMAKRDEHRERVNKSQSYFVFDHSHVIIHTKRDYESLVSDFLTGSSQKRADEILNGDAYVHTDHIEYEKEYLDFLNEESLHYIRLYVKNNYKRALALDEIDVETMDIEGIMKFLDSQGDEYVKDEVQNAYSKLWESTYRNKQIDYVNDLVDETFGGTPIVEDGKVSYKWSLYQFERTLTDIFHEKEESYPSCSDFVYDYEDHVENNGELGRLIEPDYDNVNLHSNDISDRTNFNEYFLDSFKEKEEEDYRQLKMDLSSFQRFYSQLNQKTKH